MFDLSQTTFHSNFSCHFYSYNSYDYMNNNFDSFTLILGNIDTIFIKVKTDPVSHILDISEYTTVAVSLAPNNNDYEYKKQFEEKFAEFAKFIAKTHTFSDLIFEMPIAEAKKMFDLFLGDLLLSEEKIQPCTKCGLDDHWNSKNNGKWYCYKHCSY